MVMLNELVRQMLGQRYALTWCSPHSKLVVCSWCECGCGMPYLNMRKYVVSSRHHRCRGEAGPRDGRVYYHLQQTEIWGQVCVGWNCRRSQEPRRKIDRYQWLVLTYLTLRYRYRSLRTELTGISGLSWRVTRRSLYVQSWQVSVACHDELLVVLCAYRVDRYQWLVVTSYSSFSVRTELTGISGLSWRVTHRSLCVQNWQLLVVCV